MAMKHIKCHHFDSVTGTQHKPWHSLSTTCNFAHPDEAAWAAAKDSRPPFTRPAKRRATSPSDSHSSYDYRDDDRGSSRRNSDMDPNRSPRASDRGWDMRRDTSKGKERATGERPGSDLSGSFAASPTGTTSFAASQPFSSPSSASPRSTTFAASDIAARSTEIRKTQSMRTDMPAPTEPRSLASARPISSAASSPTLSIHPPSIFPPSSTLSLQTRPPSQPAVPTLPTSAPKSVPMELSGSTGSVGSAVRKHSGPDPSKIWHTRIKLLLEATHILKDKEATRKKIEDMRQILSSTRGANLSASRVSATEVYLAEQEKSMLEMDVQLNAVINALAGSPGKDFWPLDIGATADVEGSAKIVAAVSELNELRKKFDKFLRIDGAVHNSADVTRGENEAGPSSSSFAPKAKHAIVASTSTTPSAPSDFITDAKAIAELTQTRYNRTKRAIQRAERDSSANREMLMEASNSLDESTTNHITHIDMALADMREEERRRDLNIAARRRKDRQTIVELATSKVEEDLARLAAKWDRSIDESAVLDEQLLKKSRELIERTAKCEERSAASAIAVQALAKSHHKPPSGELTLPATLHPSSIDQAVLFAELMKQVVEQILNELKPVFEEIVARASRAARDEHNTLYKSLLERLRPAIELNKWLKEWFEAVESGQIKGPPTFLPPGLPKARA